jgi:ABC-2 type transport system ATP-binding protein
MERIPSLKEYTIRRLKRNLAFQEFWALKKVSFQVARGECFGIIGPNGAGKSTLLKVIARVLHPTSGRVRVWGRVCPLLELGAGFDAELTGRENIFLNGTILGFTRKDLEARQRRIIEFAGLQEFIDAPLRTYSSGMMARLGFAIVTDEKPDILIIDEILSVGDAEFQEKSGKRMSQFLHSGTTILLVSHSLHDIQKFCRRAIWLQQGRLKAEGPSERVIRQYQDFISEHRPA